MYICIRIKTALSTIYEGLQAMKSFKLAISQQNLLKVSQCLLNMSSKLDLLYESVQFTTILLPNVSPSTYAVDYTSFGPLFNLQESIWYFANGLPTGVPMVKTGSDGLTYYQSSNSSAYNNHGFFYVNYGVQPDGLEKSLIAVLEELLNFKDNIITENELVNVRIWLK